MKQSSVDWLFDQLWETPKDKITWFNILMDAKEKHEEEFIDALSEYVPINIAQQQYNENFK